MTHCSKLPFIVLLYAFRRTIVQVSSIPVKSAKILILNITLHSHLFVKTMCANSLLRVKFALVCVISQVWFSYITVWTWIPAKLEIQFVYVSYILYIFQDSCPNFHFCMCERKVIWVALVSVDPLFVDPYAGCLVSPNIRMEMKPQIPRYCIATKFIDDKMLNTLQTVDDFRQVITNKNVVETINLVSFEVLLLDSLPLQVVLLTDGMDTRPYRLNWPRSTMIFDISPQKVFEMTTQKLGGIDGLMSFLLLWSKYVSFAFLECFISLYTFLLLYSLGCFHTILVYMHTLWCTHR